MTHSAPYVPSLADIKRECAQVQRKWSDREREKRGAVKREAWLPPETSGRIYVDDGANLNLEQSDE